jgi:hypothetical protein
MRNRIAASVLAAFFLATAACNGPLGVSPSRFLGQAGPGDDDHQCANETPPSPVTPGTVSEAAAADGGQRSSNHPVQSDPGARGIHTVWTRGGETTDSSSTIETRQQAGAPSVNQGLILPTSAEAGGGGSQAVNEAAKTVASLRAALQLALAGNAPNVDAISKMLSDAQTALANAEAGARPVVTYNLQGSTSTQTVANGSAAGSEGGSVSAPASRVRQPSGPSAPGAPAVIAPPEPAPAAPAAASTSGMGG